MGTQGCPVRSEEFLPVCLSAAAHATQAKTESNGNARRGTEERRKGGGGADDDRDRQVANHPQTSNSKLHHAALGLGPQGCREAVVVDDSTLEKNSMRFFPVFLESFFSLLMQFHLKPNRPVKCEPT